jgi:hypothetical protein
MKNAILVFALCGMAHAQFHLNSISTTPTQATISYNPGTSAACTLNVTDSTGATVNDVNTALGGDFAGSNLDSRAGNTALGNNRTFVVGQRTTGVAANGFPYSRALTALSQYTGQFTCNGFLSPSFPIVTQNIPVGDTHNEGVPVDRAHPGKYALEGMRWTVAGQKFIDPFKGVSATRTTAPADVATTAQAFVTAIGGAGWSGSPIGGTATFSGTGSMSDAMFTRADGFPSPASFGGASYETANTSFDWMTASITGSTSGSASVVRCIVVNGVSCPANTQVTTVLTGTPTPIPTGTGDLMDLWQSSGPAQISAADVSTATGTAIFTSGANTLAWASGNKFSIKWVNGSTITVGGTQYTISSTQSENQITLASGPASGTYTFTANNFGVLWWCTAACTLTNVTYAYGSAPMPSWPDASTNSTSTLVTYAGQSGYLTFLGGVLTWLPANLSAPVALGTPIIVNDGQGWPGAASQPPCNTGNWDPAIPGAYYCALSYFDGTYHLVQFLYKGSLAPATSILDCIVTSNVQPCIQYTEVSNSIVAGMQALNPTCAAATASNALPSGGMGGIYYATAFGIGGAQDWFACVDVISLGTSVPRVHEGTVGGVANIAAMNTYQHAPFSWCPVHDIFAPSGNMPGWMGMGSSNNNAGLVYTITFSPALTTSLIPCPPNPFGVPTTGNLCSTVTTSGTPLHSGTSLNGQVNQVGDVMFLAGANPNVGGELLRALAVSGSGASTSLTVHRGYLGTPIAASAITSMVMICGTQNYETLPNITLAGAGLWNFAADPTGLNPGYATMNPNVYSSSGHGNGSLVNQSGTIITSNTSLTLCPTGTCDNTWPGDYVQAGLAGAATNAFSISPTFAGVMGLSQPNQVDTHAGPAFSNWVMDARPFNGGQPSQGTSGAPFVNTTGQLWVLQSVNTLNRKILSTLAYVGRSALVDVSGPNSASNFGSTSANSYEYCIPLIGGECVAGSTIGWIYVNAPFVSLPYCNENPQNGSQGDDNNYICIADLGAYTGQIAQMGWQTNDITGATSRGLGGAHNVWNQQYGFWNANNIPTGLLSANYARWLDGLRTEVITAILPPFPSPDGVNRSTFVSIPISLPGGPNVASAEVQFWYQEAGAGCTISGRQEACVANAATVNQTTPFSWVSENPPPLACATGCTISLPALSGHTLYYKSLYYNAGGGVIYTSGSRQVTIP